MPKLTVRPIVSGLTIPWDVAFTPDGTMLITERSGNLYSRSADGHVRQVRANFRDTVTSREVGLMGIAVDPSFSTNRRFYTCLAYKGPEVQVVAWAMKDDYSQAYRLDVPLVRGIPLTDAKRHGGCRIRFGPDGYLWITTGDATDPSAPQSLSSLGGKVLRINAQTGEGAPDNPFNTRVYTYGHRNPQGLAFRPGTKQAWLVEHGPDHDDEINLLVSGGNYGWKPDTPYGEDVPMTNRQAFPDAIEAKWESGYPAVAPSGATFIDDASWGAWNGRLAVALLKQKHLKVFEFDSDGTLLSETLVPELDQKYGRLRSPVFGPDGALYVTTSNGSGKDHVLQVFGPSTPRLSGPDSVTYASGGTEPVATFSSHHLLTPVSWTVSGQDDKYFSISSEGVLSFLSPPNSDNAIDYDADNVYRVLVKAEAAGGGDSAEQAIAVTVPGPLPEVSIAASINGVLEGGEAIFVLSAYPSPASNMDVSLTVSARGNHGITTGQRSFTFPGSESNATLIINTTNDRLSEADGEVTVTVNAGSGYTVSATRDAGTMEIWHDNSPPEVPDHDGPPEVPDDDSPPPVVSIVARGDITEGDTAVFTISGSPPPSSPIMVKVGVSQSGDFGASGATSVPFMGATTSYSITTSDDDADEADGSVTVTLQDGQGYTVSSTNGSATVVVADNDVPELSITGGSGITEGGTASFTITASSAPTGPVTVKVEVSEDGDFGASGAATVTVSGSTASYTVITSNDAVNEADGSVTATLQDGDGYTVSSTKGSATVVVADNDAPAVSIAAGSWIAEGGVASFTITANPAPANPVTVKVGVSQSGDFGASGAATVQVSGATTTYSITTSDDAADEADGSVTATLEDGEGYTVSSTKGAATVAVADDDAPTLKPSSEPPVVTVADAFAEEGDYLEFLIRLSHLHTKAVEVIYITAEWQARSPEDYSFATDAVTIPAGQTHQTVRIATVADEEDEGTERMILEIVLADGLKIADWEAVGTISDAPVQFDGPKPMVIVAGGSGITEGGTASFTITASPPPSSPITVKVGVSQSGDFGASGAATVQVSGATVSYSITTSDDAADEVDGSVTATLQDAEGYIVSPTKGSATVAVADNDAAETLQQLQQKPEVSIKGGSGITEGGTASFTITVSPAPTNPITVKVGVSQSGDFGASGAATVQVSGATTIYSITTSDDAADEADGSVTATLQDGQGYTVSSTKGSATVAVADNDAAQTLPQLQQKPEVSIKGGSGITEGGTASFTITASPKPTAALGVSVTVTQSGDYGVSTGTQTVTIPTTGSTTLSVATTGDSADEADGSVTATLNGGNGYTVSVSHRVATVAVADDDVTPEINVTAARGGTEGVDATFTLTANPTPTADLDVSVTVAATGDYGVTTGAQTVTIPTTGSATLKLTTDDDAVDEADGSITVTVNADTGYTVGALGSETVAILDDDEPPAQEQADDDPQVKYADLIADVRGYIAEPNRVDAHRERWNRVLLAFGISENGFTGAPMTASEAATYQAKWPSDANGIDRWGPVVEALTWVEAQASEETDDTDDTPPLPEVSISRDGSGAITEGGTATFTISASPAPAGPITVNVSVGANSFGASGASTVTVSGASVTYTVTTVNDQTDEPSGSVTVTLASGSGYDLGSPSSASFPVADDDDPPVVSISGGPAITEGGSAVFTITRDTAAAASLTVSVTVAESGDFAQAGQTGARTVTIAANAASAALSVSTENDAVDEPDGSITATLADGTDYDLGSPAATTVAVSDDDAPAPPPIPVVSISGGTAVTEGGDATFTLAASPLPTKSISVQVTVTASGDYGVSTNTRAVTIGTDGAGSLTVSTTGDSIEEPDGLVTATLADGTDYDLGASKSATVDIIDDDVTPEISITGGNGVTEGGSAVFTISASPKPMADLGVSVTVSQSGDYGVSTGTQKVTIPTTGSTTLSVATTDDSTDEPDGSVTATLADGTDYDLGASKSATVDIIDDDVTPEISITGGNGVTEGGSAVFTISASPKPTADMDVSVTVTALGNYGVTTGSQTVTIPTTGSATLSVATTGDSADEDDGSVTVTLKADTGYTVSSTQGVATVAVSDDDDPPSGNSGTLTVSITGPSSREIVRRGESLRFTISLSEAAQQEVTISYRLSDTKGMIAGLDYCALPTDEKPDADFQCWDLGLPRNHDHKVGQVTIVAGEDSMTLPIWITADAWVPGKAWIFVTLTGVEGAKEITDGSAGGVINE